MLASCDSHQHDIASRNSLCSTGQRSGGFTQSRNPSDGGSIPGPIRTRSRTRLRDLPSSVTPGMQRSSSARGSSACRVTRFTTDSEIGFASLSAILGQRGCAIGVCRFNRIEGSVRYFYRLVRFVLVNDFPGETLRSGICRHHDHTMCSRLPDLMLDGPGDSRWFPRPFTASSPSTPRRERCPRP
jgi:hypothetical protein